MYRKIIILIAICFTGLFILTGCEDKEPVKNNEEIKSDGAVLAGETIEGIKIGQLSVVYEDNVSKIVTTVENTNEEDYNLRIISIKLYNKEDNLLGETSGYIGSVIKAKEVKTLTASITKDLRESVKVEYEILK